MKEPEDYINDITGFIDPFHIIIPKYDAKVRKYRDLVHRYNMIYYDIVKRKGEDWADKRGIKPMVLLEVAGTSISLPELPLGEVAAADLTRGAAETEISEAKIEEMRDRINVINVDARMAGGGATTEPRPGYTPLYTDYVDETHIDRPMYEHIRRTKNPVYTKAEAKKKYGGALINGTDVLQTLVYMFQDAKGYATEAMKNRGGIKKIVERAWKAFEDGNNDHQNHILQIINNHGLYLQGRTFEQIKEILNTETFDASIMASMRNQILKVLQDSTDEEDRELFEPDINLEDLQVPGEMPNFSKILEFKEVDREDLVKRLRGPTGLTMSEETANRILDKLLAKGADEATKRYMEGSPTMDAMERTSDSILETIYDIISSEQSLSSSFRINPRLIMESVLRVLNLGGNNIFSETLENFLKKKNTSSIAGRPAPSSKEEPGKEDEGDYSDDSDGSLRSFEDIMDLPVFREDIRPPNTRERISRELGLLEVAARRHFSNVRASVESSVAYGARIRERLLRRRTLGELLNFRGFQIKADRTPSSGDSSSSSSDSDDSDIDDPVRWSRIYEGMDPNFDDIPFDYDPDDPDDPVSGNVEEPRNPIRRFIITVGGHRFRISAAAIAILGGAIGVGKEIYDAVVSNPEGVNVQPGGQPVAPSGQPVAPSSGGQPVVPPGTDIDDQGNTTFVDYQNAQSMTESSGMLRASGIDPPEASLFLHTGKQARDQQRMWNEFSKVEPGFGLGSMGFNTLAQHNARADALRFKNNYKLPAKPTIVRPYKANPQIQPKLIPHFQSDFGDVILEDETPYSDYARRNQLTDERLHNNNWNQYENPNNIYMPEGRLYGFKRQPVIIPELRNNGYDRYLSNERPSRQGGVVFDDRRTGYNFGGATMDADNFDKKPKKPRDKTSNAKPQNNALRFSTRF